MSITVGIIGATGYVGSKIFQEAIFRNLNVIAITNSTPINIFKNNVKYIKADFMNINELINVLKNVDVVIYAGAPPKSFNLQQAVEFQQKAIPNIIEASLKVNAKRIIAIGGAGTLETNGIRNMDAPGFPEAFVIPSKATEMVRNLLINENKISTTILCPSLNLFEGSRTGNYRINDNNQTIFNSNNNSEISTSDLAVALIDEVFNQKYLNKVITAGY